MMQESSKAEEKRVVQHEDMDESALASLFVSMAEQARGAATRMSTWLVVGNGAALTLCYQTMISQGENAPAMLSAVAMLFIGGLFCAFASFLNLQSSLNVTASMVEITYLNHLAQRHDLRPPPPNDPKHWKHLTDYGQAWQGLMVTSALLFIVGAIAPAVGVLDPEFLDMVFGSAAESEGPLVTVAPPP